MRRLVNFMFKHRCGKYKSESDNLYCIKHWRGALGPPLHTPLSSARSLKGFILQNSSQPDLRPNFNFSHMDNFS